MLNKNRTLWSSKNCKQAKTTFSLELNDRKRQRFVLKMPDVQSLHDAATHRALMQPIYTGEPFERVAIDII